jgi:hypothetical protein
VHGNGEEAAACELHSGKLAMHDSPPPPSSHPFLVSRQAAVQPNIIVSDESMAEVKEALRHHMNSSQLAATREKVVQITSELARGGKAARMPGQKRVSKKHRRMKAKYVPRTKGVASKSTSVKLKVGNPPMHYTKAGVLGSRGGSDRCLLCGSRLLRGCCRSTRCIGSNHNTQHQTRFNLHDQPFTSSVNLPSDFGE